MLPPPPCLEQIKGYPTIKIVHKSEEYKTYKGARDTESLAAAIKEAAAELLTEST